jgi:uncharacterized protein YbaR (Trm112 family)
VTEVYILILRVSLQVTNMQSARQSNGLKTEGSRAGGAVQLFKGLRPLPEPIRDAFVKEALYMFHPPPLDIETSRRLDSSRKADRKLQEFQTARDELRKRFGESARIDLVSSEGEPMKVVAELTLPTDDRSLSENVEKAVRDKGFSLVFQPKNFEVIERLSGPTQNPEDSGVWLVRHINLYTISSRDGSATSKVENIADTAKALLRIADEVPRIMEEETRQGIAKQAEKERLLARTHSVTYPVSKPIEWARVLEITSKHFRGIFEEP